MGGLDSMADQDIKVKEVNQVVLDSWENLVRKGNTVMKENLACLDYQDLSAQRDQKETTV